MVAFDAPFPSKWPFGILMTAQWVLSFALLLALWSLDFQWAGTGLVYYTAWMTFGMELFSWIAHLFGLQKSYQVGKIYFHIPFAATDFVNSVILFPLYALSTLLCVYFIFYSLRYVGNMSVVYAFAAVLCVLAGGTCGYFALLLYRASENKPIKLLGIFIEGTSTVRFASIVESTENGGPRPTA
uniref:MARVEL domain-containing protein n=1 Tax=Plectus sambesii TaxID=2011161 RepID=A0A914XLF7_9BILA